MKKTVCSKIAIALLSVGFSIMPPTPLLELKAIAQSLTLQTPSSLDQSQADQTLQNANDLKRRGAGYAAIVTAYEQAFEAAAQEQSIGNLNRALIALISAHYRHCADTDAQRWVDRGIDALPSVMTEDVSIQTYRNIFNTGKRLYRALKQPDQIVTIEQQWIEFAERSQHWDAVSRGWRDIGKTYIGSENYDKAFDSFQASMDVAITHARLQEAILTTQEIGRTHKMFGNDTAAIAAYQDGFTLLEENVVSWTPALTTYQYDTLAAYSLLYADLMLIYSQLDQSAETEQTSVEVEQTVNRFLRFMEQKATVERIEHIVTISHTSQASDSMLLNEGIAFSRAIGYKRGEWQSLVRLMEIAHANEDFNQAIELGQRAFELQPTFDEARRDEKDRAPYRTILWLMGQSYLAQDNYSLALRYHERLAVDIDSQKNDFSYQGSTYNDVVDTILDLHLILDQTEQYAVAQILYPHATPRQPVPRNPLPGFGVQPLFPLSYTLSRNYDSDMCIQAGVTRPAILSPWNSPSPPDLAPLLTPMPPSLPAPPSQLLPTRSPIPSSPH